MTERIARQDPGQASAVRQNDSGKTLRDPKLKVRLFKTWAFQTPSRQQPVANAKRATGHKQHGRSKSPRNFPIHNDKQHHRSDKGPELWFRIRVALSPHNRAWPCRSFPLRGMALGALRLRDRYLSNSPLDCLRGIDGGAERDRTDDLLLAKQALSQLSYGPFAPTRATRG